MPPAVESLPRQPHPRKPTCREASTRPILALRAGADTGLPALLLGSDLRQRFLGHAGVFRKNIDLDEQYPDLVEQENLILRKCRGVPLAIVTVGVFLADKPKTVFEWSKLNEDINVELELNRELETIGSSILGKIYDGLPYHLKSVVLCLPIFPGDYKVRRRRLIRRWTAEEYSRELRGRSAEEIAGTYFMELVSRSIILPCHSEIGTRKGINSCQVHSSISEIAITGEENLVFKLEEGCSQNTQGTVRHLAVSNNWKGDQSELERIVDMSLLDLEHTSGLVDHHLKHIGKLIHLRYLSLRGCGDIYHLPGSLGNLRQLETLDVKGTKIINLPKTISKLTKLQHVLAGYLEAEDDGIYESISDGLPKLMRNKLGLMTVFSAGFCVACCAPYRMKQQIDIDGDVNRRDVCTMCCCAMLPALVKPCSAGGVGVPRGINKLKSLLTLGTVNVSGRRKTTLQDIEGFTRLRKFGVAGINRSNGKELRSAITHLRRLESLSVWSDPKHCLDGCLDDIVSPPEKLQSLKLYGRLGRLPDWIRKLENLVKLKLQSSQLLEISAAMKVLGSLPNLAILILLENSFKGDDLCFSFQAESFPSLVVLQLQCLDVVEMVLFDGGATPRLEVLRFGLSSYGGCRLRGLECLPSLKEVGISNPGRYNEYMKEDMLQQLYLNPNLPVLKMGN
ncbi:disease resistance protein PIK6-NP-like [Lolium rigidum]|uniref:disease resistance protein PIK6-NP-like n=1 Tax=Lolium rigidum TaxID=89674 RepID=UPI001F5E2E72|nr:disease resistance protein PIK6-NP-like [Lolium rigidum]